ncbi:hypothetical protein P4O66_007301 [Electrophorus voltai]|uniref:Ig-like domain-containing protein n=1 Tax=Electrophorus voltai TaxID=2609070 RepID=A0AAD9DYS7_9TELE|nr:hypothetical protein P4O66_007301 [Electrophorus voltai]
MFTSQYTVCRFPGGRAASFAESSKPVDLTITLHRLMNCEVPIVLECSISSAENYNVIRMEWVEFCNLSALGPQCKYRKNESLNLTIPSCNNLKDKQEYFCAVQTDNGHAIKNISLTVEDCKDISLVSVQANQKHCVFCVNDSKGQVNWFHGNNNVTSKATNNRQWKTPNGHLKISSELPIQEDADQYYCSLWLPNNSQQSGIFSHFMNKSRLLWLFFIFLILLSYILS